MQTTPDPGVIVLVGATLSLIGQAEGGRAEWGVLVSKSQVGISIGLVGAAQSSIALAEAGRMEFDLVGDGLRDVLDPGAEAR